MRLLIDAEHSYFQPAIDNTVTELQRQVRRCGAANGPLTTGQALRDMQMRWWSAVHSLRVFAGQAFRAVQTE